MSNRYAKQELFLGKSGQADLQDAHVLIIGAGALGSSSSEMLARAGIGSLTIVDRDYVEWSNLQRQQLYTEDDAVNKLPKAVAAKNRLQQINSEITVNSLIMDINASNIEGLIKGKSVILDATDNFETRMIINDAAVKHRIPFLFGACVASYGLTFSILPGKTPCLNCLMTHLPLEGITCDTVGVISPIVQLVTAYQVTHALQLLTGYDLEPIIQSFDIWKNEQAEINIAKLKNKNCPTCGESPSFPYLAYENQTKADVLCGRDAIQIRPATSMLIDLHQLAKDINEVVTNVMVNPYLLSCTLEEHRIVLFKDGRAIIHGTNKTSRARTIYNRVIQCYKS